MWTQRQTRTHEECHVSANAGRDWGDSSTNPGMSKTASKPPVAWGESQKSFSSTALRKNWPGRWLPASRTWEDKFLLFKPPRYFLCSNPRKLIHACALFDILPNAFFCLVSFSTWPVWNALWVTPFQDKKLKLSGFSCDKIQDRGIFLERKSGNFTHGYSSA